MIDWGKYTPPIIDEHYAETKADESASSFNSDLLSLTPLQRQAIEALEDDNTVIYERLGSIYVSCDQGVAFVGIDGKIRWQR